MILYFIRHKPSGHYLPEPAGRMGRGGSHVEPTNQDPPRIFTTERSARCALTQWLRGKFTASRGYDYSNDEYYEELELTPIPSRKKSDMEIVPVTVNLP